MCGWECESIVGVFALISHDSCLSLKGEDEGELYAIRWLILKFSQFYFTPLYIYAMKIRIIYLYN